MSRIGRSIKEKVISIASSPPALSYGFGALGSWDVSAKTGEQQAHLCWTKRIEEAILALRQIPKDRAAWLFSSKKWPLALPVCERVQKEND